MAGFFAGKQTWDPWQICSQIAALQAAFYAGLFFIELMLVAPYVMMLSPRHLLSADTVNTLTFTNSMVCLSFLLNAGVTAVAMRFVVARAKKCWDFGATVYLAHLALTSLYAGFPVRWLWWATMAVCSVVTVLLGELLCVRHEMADIPITTRGAGASTRSRRPQAGLQEEGTRLLDIEAQVPLSQRSAPVQAS